MAEMLAGFLSSVAASLVAAAVIEGIRKARALLESHDKRSDDQA